MTATRTAKASIRKIGNKHDYIRRYGVYVGGKRVDGVTGGLQRWDAQSQADDLNDVPLEDRDI